MNKPKPGLMARKENLAGYLFAAPGILGLLIFSLGPILVSVYYSFTKVSVIDEPRWVGLDNFYRIFKDPSSFFMKSLGVTLFYALVNVALVMLFSLAVAMLLNRKFKGRNTLRAIFFLPSVLPTVATTTLLIWMLDYRSGLVNQLLNMLNIGSVNWLMDERLVFVSLFALSLWMSGGSIVVMIATLQDVPVSLLEATDVDGGNAWTKFRHIMIPSISPVLFFQTVMSLVSSLQIFTQSLMLSNNGSPNRMTYFINVMIYDDAFSKLRMGMASAEAWVMFVVVLALTGLLFGTKKLWVYEG